MSDFSNVITSLKEVFVKSGKIFIDMFKKAGDPKNRSVLVKCGILIIFAVISCVVLYYAANDKSALMSKTYLYFFLAAIPIILVMGYVLPLYNAANSSFYKIFIIVAVVVIFCCIFYSYTSLNATTSLGLAIVVNFLLFLIIVFGMGIFFIIFSNYLKSLTGFQGFMVYLIFYIPCLVVDFFRYLLREFKTTTSDVYSLFILEIIFVLIYIYMPKLLSTMSSKNGIVLLEKSAYLDIPSSLDTSAIVIAPSKDPLEFHNTTNFRKNYAISMWIYMNAESANNVAYSKESPIFNYGDGKPMITYFNDVRNSDGSDDFLNPDKYFVYFTNTGDSNNYKKINLPSQKWNNLVFNYFSDHADLFVNGNLELTFSFDDTNYPIYDGSDAIDIGNKDGLNGAICNIRYYNMPLSKSKIVSLYNLLMYKNPPIFL